MSSDQIRTFRSRMGWTQAKMARVPGYDEHRGTRNVLRYEKGHVETPALVARIVAAMERDPPVRLVFEALAG